MSLSDEIKLQEQIADEILSIANLFDEVTTSDLQGLASVAASNIIKACRAGFVPVRPE